MSLLTPLPLLFIHQSMMPLEPPFFQQGLMNSLHPEGMMAMPFDPLAFSLEGRDSDLQLSFHSAGTVTIYQLGPSPPFIQQG